MKRRDDMSGHRPVACVLIRIWMVLCLAFAMGSAAIDMRPAVAETRLTLTEAKKRLAEGRDAVTRKKPQVAIEKLTAAISSKRLRYKELAQALYLRGLAHRDTEKTALAIEDLTAALWIRNGLNADDRKAALEARSSAYAQAGLTSQPGVATRTASAARATPAPTPQTRSRTAATQLAQTQTPARAQRSTARNVAPTEDWPPPSQFSSSGQTPGTQLPAAVNGLADVGQNVTQFFSGLFGGNTSGASTPAPPATASVPASTPTAPPAAATSGWASQTAVAPRAAPTTTGSVRAARIKIQVAAVRAQSTAREIAGKVNARLGSALNGQKADVRRIQAGNFGALYRVELGPFASERDTRPACAQLRRDGFDCLVLKQ